MQKQIFNNYRSFVKLIGMLCLMVVAATSLTGCITFLTQINIRGDGSGTMVQTMTMNPEQIKKSVEDIAKQMGASTSEVKEDSEKKPVVAEKEGPFKEDDLKGKAADLGAGVTFVSAEKIDTQTASGVRVTYAFKDINQLAVNPKPAAAMGTDGAGASSPDALKFRFERRPDGNALLKVLLPRPKAEEAKEPATAPQPAAPVEPDPQMAKMIMQMFKGLHMGLIIDVQGKIIKTNSPYVDGTKITLMDIDFDPLLADEQGFKTLSGKLEKAMGDDRKTMEALKGVKGLKITTDQEISIEFASE
jgi:hypothetical protein